MKPMTLAIGAATLVALAIFGWTLVHALWYAPEAESPTVPNAGIQTTATPGEYPSRLQIPALNIDANVQQVGVKADGHMANPNNFTDVGWYKAGTVPGKVGSAVMAGHVDNGLALAGVFKHLGDVKVGDDIYVLTKEGKKLHYRIEEIESYNYLQVPLEKLFNRSDKARLNLVTCEGNWVKNEKTYDQRLVIYTVLVSE